MKKISGKLISVHAGSRDDYSKPVLAGVEVALEGFPGDKHRGFERIAQSWDDEATGTIRRNERQWSGVSVEELEIIREKLDLGEPLAAATLGANLCVEGIPNFSQLPRGTKLVFPSGAALLIEEDNPPCHWMGEAIAKKHSTRSGGPVERKMFPQYALGLRGVVGVVNVPGAINPGDVIMVHPYQTGDA